MSEPRYRWNLHVHTYRSSCGQPEMTLEAIIPEALDLGFAALALTDHVDLGTAVERELLRLNVAEVAQVQAPLQVLVGVEAMMHAPDHLSLPAEWARELDFVMVAANHYHLDCVQQPPTPAAGALAAHCLVMTEAAINCGYCDVIAHPLLCKLMPEAMQELAQAYDRAALRRLLEQAGERQVAMELNPRLVRQCPDFFAEFITLAQQAGVRFTVGTDAHRLAALAYDEGCASLGSLYRLGLRPQDLLPPAELAGRRR